MQMRYFMVHFSKKITIYLISSIFFIFTLNATSSFSGFTGLKINYSANSIDSEVCLARFIGIVYNKWRKKRTHRNAFSND